MKRLLLPLFLVSSLLSSCGEEKSTGPFLNGSIWGYIELVDEDQNLLTDQSGVSVTLEGTNYSTISDAGGKWTLENVPAGVYEIAFGKDGFGWTKQQEQFVGTGDLFLGSRRLGQIPTFSVVDFSVEIDPSQNSYKFHAYVSGIPSSISNPKLDIFYSTDSASFELSDRTLVAEMSPRESQSNDFWGSTYIHNLGRRELSGTTLYLKAYPSSNFKTRYFDPLQRVYFYTGHPSVGSEVSSIVLP